MGILPITPFSLLGLWTRIDSFSLVKYARICRVRQGEASKQTTCMNSRLSGDPTEWWLASLALTGLGVLFGPHYHPRLVRHPLRPLSARALGDLTNDFCYRILYLVSSLQMGERSS